MHWFIDPIKNHYADFEGRAGRQEFWMFILVYLGVAIAVSVVTTALQATMLSLLFGLAMIAPSWAIAARRLHDINKSGWWQLVSLIPFGIILLIVWLASESKNEGNRFGAAKTTAVSESPAPEAPPVPESTDKVPVEEPAPAEKENTKEGFGN